MSKIVEFIKKLKDGSLKEFFREAVWICRVAKKYIKHVVCFVTLNITGILITTFLFLRLENMVNALMDKDTENLIQLAVFYIILGLTGIILGMLNQRYGSFIFHTVRRDLTMETFDILLKSKWEKLTQFHSGDIITRLNDDVSAIAGSVSGWIPCLIAQSFQLIIAVSVIIAFDPSMILLIIIVAPIILLGSKMFLNKLYASNQKQREFFSELMSFHKETFHNIQAIKAFGLDRLFYQKRSDLEDRNYSLGMEVNKYSISSWGMTYLCTQISGAICMIWMGYRLISGAITFGEIAVLFLFAKQVSGSAKELLRLIPNGLSAATAATRVREIMALPEERIKNEEHYNKMLELSREKGASVEIKDVEFSYDNDNKVFDGVSITANPGEMVALVGPSGEGKTTMLRLILALIKQQSGEAKICVGGEEGLSMEIDAGTRKFISYVPQGNTMMKGTIAENMRMTCPGATDEDIINALKGACAYDEFVKKLPDGINHSVGEGGGGFSEGQNQRLALARALMNPSPILLLDEATSALDVVTERKVLKNLMQHENIRTCILTTHRPSVLGICDKVYRIANHEVNLIGEEEIQILMHDF